MSGRGAERETHTQNLKQAPGSELSAQTNPQTTRSRPESKSDAQLTEPPRCPLKMIFFFKELN